MKIISILISLMIMWPFNCGAEVIPQKKMEIGDYVVIGKYKEEPILWRCVANDENGNLMLSDKILCYKSFDSHGRNVVDYYDFEAGSHNGKCIFSNYWGDSNIRSWLISTNKKNEVEWLCGITPQTEFEKTDAGFLSHENFTESELRTIKKVKLKTTLDFHLQYMATEGRTKTSTEDWYGGLQSYKLDSAEAEAYYEETASKTTSESVFLINYTQMRIINKNSNLLGDYLARYELTAYAKEQLPLLPKSSKINSWWMRDPDEGNLYFNGGQTESGFAALTIESMSYNSKEENVLQEDYETFKVSGCDVNCFSGVRPAFYLNEENAQILSGSGTKDDPYVLDGKPVPERFEENGLYGYKDADGNVIVPAKYLKAWEFSEGSALVVLPEDPYRLRYIDTTGNYLFDKAFYASNNFNNGYALVLVADDPKYTYIDKTGEFATALLFDDAEDFCGGYARVQIDGKWGVVDTNFSFKVPCEYDNKDEVLGKLDLS